MSEHGSHEFGRDCPACIEDSKVSLLCPVCRRAVAEVDTIRDLRAQLAATEALLAATQAAYERASKAIDAAKDYLSGNSGDSHLKMGHADAIDAALRGEP